MFTLLNCSLTLTGMGFNQSVFGCLFPGGLYIDSAFYQAQALAPPLILHLGPQDLFWPLQTGGGAGLWPCSCPFGLGHPLSLSHSLFFFLFCFYFGSFPILSHSPPLFLALASIFIVSKFSLLLSVSFFFLPLSSSPLPSHFCLYFSLFPSPTHYFDLSLFL